jgi:hypothetical protein
MRAGGQAQVQAYAVGNRGLVCVRSHSNRWAECVVGGRVGMGGQGVGRVVGLVGTLGNDLPSAVIWAQVPKYWARGGGERTHTITNTRLRMAGHSLVKRKLIADKTNLCVSLSLSRAQRTGPAEQLLRFCFAFHHLQLPVRFNSSIPTTT